MTDFSYRTQRSLKRLTDILAAGMGLCLLLPLMVIVALLVRCTEGQPVFYREDRVGRRGKLFSLYKFRTLRRGSADKRTVAPEDDPRITSAGLFLRRWRLDEFPQLVNVLCGEMSLVGPRPMPPAHADTLPAEQLALLLSVRPGITDPAAIYFLAEDEVLAGQADPERLYLEHFLPVKSQMQIDSLQHWSLMGDARIVARTLMLLWSRSARNESAQALHNLLIRPEA